MKTLQIYFATDSRPWTPQEIQFVISTLNDKRSWGVPVIVSNDIKAPVVFYLSFTKTIQKRYVGTSFETTTLSITDRNNPYQFKVFFNLDNWTSIPKTSGYN